MCVQPGVNPTRLTSRARSPEACGGFTIGHMMLLASAGTRVQADFRAEQQRGDRRQTTILGNAFSST